MNGCIWRCLLEVALALVLENGQVAAADRDFLKTAIVNPPVLCGHPVGRAQVHTDREGIERRRWTDRILTVVVGIAVL